MTSEIIQIIPVKDRCQECRRKTATRLCDFAIGQFGITFYRDYQKFKNQNTGPITCDRMMCDDCSNRFHGWDLCKGHYKETTGGRR